MPLQQRPDPCTPQPSGVRQVLTGEPKLATALVPGVTIAEDGYYWSLNDVTNTKK